MRNDVQFGGVVSWNGRNELLSAAVDLSSGDAIPHHYLFTASLLRSCLTLSYKGLMFKVIVCQKTFLLASNTNPPPPPEVRKPQETWLQIWRIFSLTSTSITPKLKFGREKEPSDTYREFNTRLICVVRTVQVLSEPIRLTKDLKWNQTSSNLSSRLLQTFLNCDW